ncbi:MAG: hypothetical protein V7765_05245 [Oleispira sp.]
MTKLINTSVLKPILVFLMMTLGMALSATGQASELVNEIAVNLALETAQVHTPGKVVAHEKADERVSDDGTAKSSKTLQPVYRIKILSQQGVMKTLLVHRQTGLVVE